jgi:hypothetical protein
MRHAYLATKIRILEMGLVYRFHPHRLYAHGISDAHDSFTNHPGLIANLISCTDAAKDYFDCFLQIETQHYHSLTLEEWFGLILAAFALFRLCLGLREVPEWTPETARATIDLEKYFSRIHDQLQAAREAASETDKAGAESLYALLPQIFENVTDSFVAAKDGFVTSPDGVRAHQDLRFGPEHLPSTGKQVRCPATRNLPTTSSSYPSNTPPMCKVAPEELASDLHNLQTDAFLISLPVLDESFLMAEQEPFY